MAWKHSESDGAESVGDPEEDDARIPMEEVHGFSTPKEDPPLATVQDDFAGMFIDFAPDISTWENALQWLGANLSTGDTCSDDFIVSIATVKKAENSTDQALQENVTKAVRLIAEYRNSDSLRAWLLTGDVSTSSAEDELAAAYRFFNITDRSNGVDKETLQVYYEVVCADEDSDSKKAEALKYRDILLNLNTPISITRADYTKAVGLANNGNTCYLNSLLQYYFAVKPFRDIILNFDKYRQSIDPETEANFGKVEGALITRQGVEDGHKFVSQLAVLFQQMYQAPGPSVLPSLVLACLALEPPPIPQSGNRRNTIVGASAPKFDESNGMKDEVLENNSESEDQAILGDESSDITLVGDVIMTPESDSEERVLDSAEKPIDDQDAPRDSMEVQMGNSEPPSRDPPAVPPRPAQAQDMKSAAERAARQQDAKEVALYIVQKTLSAIKPYDIGTDGERADQIRDIFYGAYKYIYPHQNLANAQYHDPNLIIPLEDKPRDIYEGLAYVFQRELVEHENEQVERYHVVTKAPPVLQLYLQNQWYDQDAKAAKKIEHHVKLNETIYLDRYMGGAAAELESLRSLSWDMRDRMALLKKELAELQVSKDLTSEAAFDALADLMYDLEEEGITAAEGLQEKLEAKAHADKQKLLSHSLEHDELGRELDALPFDEYHTQQNCYKIFAVFVHRGSSDFGHWWIYIRDFKKNIWRKFNDANVTELADDSEIFKKNDAIKDGGAAFVVYVRDDLKDEMVDPLYREAPDETMEDASGPSTSGGGEDEVVEVREVEMMPLLSDY